MQANKFTLLAAVGVAGLVFSSSTHAHGPILSLTDFVVESRSTDLTGVARTASEGRVGQVEISSRPILRTAEVLEVIPGFVATQHSGTGKANQYFLRGFNLDHGTDFSTSVDGMPLNLPTHGNGQGYLDINHIIPELVMTVDYQKGTYATERGDFSSAGSANLRLFDELPSPVITLGIGENDFYRLVEAGSVRTDAGVLLGAVEAQYSDGPWVEPEEGTKLNGLVRWSTGDTQQGMRLTGMLYDGEWNSTDQIPLRLVESGQLNRFGAVNPTNGGNTERYSLQAEGWTTTESGARTQGQVYVSYYSFDLWSDFTYFLEDPVNGDQFHQFDDRVYLGGEVTHEWNTKTENFSFINRVGLQARHDMISEVGLENSVNRAFLAPIRKDEVDQTSLGIYYENTAFWTDTVRTVLGVRADAYFFDVENEATPLNSGSADDQIVSPKGSIIFGPFSQTEFYVSAGTGFHSNDARGTTTTIDPGTGEMVDPVDPLVATFGAEVGVRTTIVPGLHTTLTLWTLESDSELLFVGDAGTTEPSGASERYGVELANFYEVNSWLVLDFDLTYTEARFSDEPSDADEIPGAIPLVIAAGATVNFDNGFFGSLRLRHFGEYPLTEDGSVKADSSSRVNLQLGYRIPNKGWSIHMDVLNLLDAEDNDIEYFFASRLQGEPAEGVEDVHFHPAEPRQLRFYVTKTF